MMVRLTIILNKSWGHAGYQGTSCDDGKTHHYPEQARGHAGYQGTSCDDGKTHHYPEQAMGTSVGSHNFIVFSKYVFSPELMT